MQVGFKSFLNITPTVLYPTPQGPIREFSLVFDENPLADFVELPDDAVPPRSAGAVPTSSSQSSEGLWYSNVLCGVVRGALEMVRIYT